jgi:L-alanine-DL-glutamate epimerase-like enolase superfamily enzyme
MVDANQGYSVDLLDRLLPVLVETNVALVEQPVRRGDEATLLGLKSPIPLAADESVLALEDLPLLVGVFEVANIKLDKCGGLTEALLMEREARRLGLHVMVGNMGGSSLAAAPAWLLGQRCDFVDLDGPAFLAHDVGGGAAYHHGEIGFADGFWGAD